MYHLEHYLTKPTTLQLPRVLYIGIPYFGKGFGENLFIKGFPQEERSSNREKG